MKVGVWWLGVVVGAALLQSACDEDTCGAGAKCDRVPDGGVGNDAVAGAGANGGARGETTPDGARSGRGGEAGEGGAGDPSAGGGQAGASDSDACDAACVAEGKGPWIVFASLDDAAALQAFKLDLLGIMRPLPLTIPIEPPDEINELRWSPNGKELLIGTRYTQIIADAGIVVDERAFMIRFHDDSPAVVEIQDGSGASRLDLYRWSPSGKQLFFLSAGRLATLDLTAAAPVLVPVDDLPLQDPRFWIKSDDEVLYLAKESASTTSARWATRKGGAWSSKLIANDLGSNVSSADVNPDLTRLYYRSYDSSSYDSLWSLNTSEPSAPQKLVGPVQRAELRFSPDASQYLLAVDDMYPPDTKLFGGAIATLSNPPLLKDNLSADPSEILPRDEIWAPSSAYAALFLPSSNEEKRQLTIYRADAAPTLQPVDVGIGVGAMSPLVWSPTSALLAFQGWRSSNSVLWLVNPTDGTTHEIASVPGSYSLQPQFSPNGDFLLFQEPYDVAAHQYSFSPVDLRGGWASAQASKAQPGILDAFAATGAALIFGQDKKGCAYWDLTSAAPPLPITGPGELLCEIQPQPASK
jgi:hypothetical protein